MFEDYEIFENSLQCVEQKMKFVCLEVFSDFDKKTALVLKTV